MIPAEAIEAAAKAIYHPQPIYDEVKEEFTGHRPWEWLTPEYQESLRNDARAALEAAAPHMLANHLMTLAADAKVRGDIGRDGGVEAWEYLARNAEQIRPTK